MLEKIPFFLLSAMTITLYLVMYMLMYAAAIRLRKEIKGEVWLILSGLISVVLGIIVTWMLLTRPLESFLALGWLLGFYAALFGAMMILLGLRLHPGNALQLGLDVMQYGGRKHDARYAHYRIADKYGYQRLPHGQVHARSHDLAVQEILQLMDEDQEAQRQQRLVERNAQRGYGYYRVGDDVADDGHDADDERHGGEEGEMGHGREVKEQRGQHGVR